MSSTYEGKTTIHDATPSWNGFNYQGKIGLYVCLSIIRDIYAKAPNHKLDDLKVFDRYELEYEWLEDFSILEAGNYLSIHQVKHYKNSTFSGYLDAIETIISRKNGIISPPEVVAYLKVPKGEDVNKIGTAVFGDLKTHGLINPDGSLVKGWESNIPKIEAAYQASVEEALSNFEKLFNQAYGKDIPVYLHTACAIAKPTKSISDYAWKNASTKNTLESDNLINLKIHLEQINEITFSLALDDDELEAALCQIIVEIRKYIKPYAVPIENTTSLQCYLAALLLEIDSHIANRHNKISAKKTGTKVASASTRTLNFSVFLELLEKDFYNHDDEHFSLCAKLIFEQAVIGRIRMLEDAIHDYSTDPIEQERCIRSKNRLEQYRRDILANLAHKTLLRYLEQASPHHKKIEPRITYFMKIAQHDAISNNLLEFIELLKSDLENFFATCDAKEKYLPSCIDVSSNASHPTHAYQRTAKLITDTAGSNAFVNMLLYDYNYLTIKAKEPVELGVPIEPPRFGDLSSHSALTMPIFHERKRTHLIHHSTAAKKINKES